MLRKLASCQFSSTCLISTPSPEDKLVTHSENGVSSNVRPEKEVQPILPSISSPQTESVPSMSQEQLTKMESYQQPPLVKHNSQSFISDAQSSTIKQEETSSPEQIRLKIRRKVCRKIFEILTKEFKIGNLEAQNMVVSFEEAVYRVYFDSDTEYMQAIKAVCNRVRVQSF